ncbi:MAG: gamma-glutamyl-gamma-aminobutyrate hydrolase family protein [Deltaproteobacteria bacterium]|nr:gamma-glutamyl-gamma-aminobutyrate hydrolase family protein [Deltaproteobacteria bacterium]
MARRPLIGVSANRFAADPQRAVFKNMELHYAEANLVGSVYRAGGLPVIIPDLRSEEAVDEFVERLDGLLLAGGADVSPLSYGRKDFDVKWPGDKVRDDYEIMLIRKTEQAGRPIFGVCRGLQIMNVAFGGTLYQDISTEKQGSLVHRDWDIYEQNVHGVKLTPGSWLESLYGKSELKVNTIHHQGVRELAPLFKATAVAPDGVVEAIEDKDGRWVRAVQWHPEWHGLDKQGVDELELVFADFVRACTYC